MGNESVSKNKTLYIELLRIFACFFVIFNHTGDFGFWLFQTKSEGSLFYFLDMFISAFCKMGVPVFLCISGAFLLNRDETVKKWLSRILRIALILLFFSIFYYVIDAVKFKGELEFGFKDFFIKIYSGNTKFHLWYLYMYLSFLFLIPFLRAVATKLEDRFFFYLLGLAVVFDVIIPFAEFTALKNYYSINPNLKVSWALSMTFLYPLIGYFLHNRIKEIKGKHLLFMWLINLFTLGVSVYLTYLNFVKTGIKEEYLASTFFDSSMLINTITVFLTFKFFFANKTFKEGPAKFICVVSPSTFGVYLLHLFVYSLDATQNVLAFFRDAKFSTMVGSLLVCIAIFAICSAFTILISKIPGGRKLLGYK